MRDQQVFSNGQDLSTLDSTGVVSTNVFDLELTGSGGDTIIEDDQIVGFMNFEILSTSNTAGDEGIKIELRGSDNANMSSSPERLGTIQINQAEIVAGAVFSIRVIKQLATKFLGVFYQAISTSMDGATVVDCYMHTSPVTPNDSIQKLPSR